MGLLHLRNMNGKMNQQPTEQDIAEFLIHNKEIILKDIKADCIKFLEREKLFTGVFKLAFDRAFHEFVVSSIKEILLKHYFAHAEIHDIISAHMIKKYTGDYFFDKSKYIE